MTVYMIETRSKEGIKEITLTDEEKVMNEALDSAEERNVDVIVTPFELPDAKHDDIKVQELLEVNKMQDLRLAEVNTLLNTILEWKHKAKEIIKIFLKYSENDFFYDEEAKEYLENKKRAEEFLKE